MNQGVGGAQLCMRKSMQLTSFGESKGNVIDQEE